MTTLSQRPFRVPPFLPRGARQLAEDAGQGAGPAGRPGLPRPRGRGRAGRQGGRPQERRGRAERAATGASQTRVVRVNDLTTHWTYRDVVEVVEGAGAHLDCVMLPKVQSAAQVAWLDLTLTQIEKTMGYEVGRIGIEAQIENAAGPDRRGRDRRRLRPDRDDHLRPGRLHGLDQHALAGGRRAAARLRRRRRLPLRADAHPDGGAGPRRAGDRRAVPADPRRGRLPPGRRPVGGARLRRQVGAAPGPDRRRQRGLLAVPGRLRPRRADPRRVRALHRRSASSAR